MPRKSSKAIAAKYKAIQQAVKEQNTKKAAESVKKPSRSYRSSSNRSKNSSSTSLSSSGLTPPSDYDGPIPPQAPSIYDEGQPLEGQQPSSNGRVIQDDPDSGWSAGPMQPADDPGDDAVIQDDPVESDRSGERKIKDEPVDDAVIQEETVSDSEKYEQLYTGIGSVSERFHQIGEKIPGNDPFEHISEVLSKKQESMYTPSEYRTKEALEEQGITSDSYDDIKEVTIPEHSVNTFPEGATHSTPRVFEEKTFSPEDESYRELVQFLSQRSEDIGQQQAVYEYQKTGEVPDYFREQVDVPENIKYLGAEKEYVQEVFESSMGLNETSVPKGFVGPPKPSDYELQQKVRGSYKNLSDPEKAEYNIRFLNWSSIPVENWKHYPGGKQYLSSLSEEKKQKIIDQYLESSGDISDTVERRQYSLGRALFPENVEDVTFGESSYSPAIERTKSVREMAWEDLTLSQSERERLYFSESSFPARLTFSTSTRFTQGVSWPVTLPQTMIKFVNKGETRFLPDLSKHIEESTAVPPSVIGSAIGEVWLGQDMGEAKKWHKEFPVESAFGLGAEVVGTYLTGKALGAARMKVRETFPPQYKFSSYDVNTTINKMVRNKQGVFFKGKMKGSQQMRRVFFKDTRFQFDSPFETVTKTGGLDFRGMRLEKPLSYVDDTGRSVFYPKGKTIWSVDKGVVQEKTLFGWKKNVFEGAGNVEPRTILNVNMGKFDVNIRPMMEEQVLRLGGEQVTSVVSHKAPLATLSLSKKQLASDIFKMGVEGSEFFAGSSYSLFDSGSKAITKSVTQTWDLPKGLSVMKRPHFKNVQLEWFTSGKPIQSLGGETIEGAGGFTITSGSEFKPKIFVESELSSKGYEGRFTPKGEMIGTEHTIRHELLHQRFPRFSEAEVSALAYKKLPVEKIEWWQKQYGSMKEAFPRHTETFDVLLGGGSIDPALYPLDWHFFREYSFAKETSQINIPSLKDTHKNVFPEVEQAAKKSMTDYSMKQGIEYPVLFGSEKYLVSPLRQFGIVEGKGFVGEIRSFGFSNVLKEIKKPTGETVSVMNLSKAGEEGSSLVLDDSLKGPGKVKRSVPTHVKGMVDVPPFLLSKPKPSFIPFVESGLFSLSVSGLVSERRSDVSRRSDRLSSSDSLQEFLGGSDLVQRPMVSLENKLGLDSSMAQVQAQDQDQLLLFDVQTPMVPMAPPVVIPGFGGVVPFALFGSSKKSVDSSSFKRKRKSDRKYAEWVSPVKMFWMG